MLSYDSVRGAGGRPGWRSKHFPNHLEVDKVADLSYFRERLSNAFSRFRSRRTLLFSATAAGERVLVAIPRTGTLQDHPPSEAAPVRRFRDWVPAILIGILISVFSTHYFSAQQTGRVIYPILRWFLPAAPQHTLYLIHVAIRKLAHIIEFGAFSIAVFHGVRGSRTGWRLNWALLTLVIAVSYAGLDEWHQSFVKFREARLRDVFIDLFGALAAQGIVWAYAKWGSYLRMARK